MNQDQPPVRPDVVQAVFAALSTMDPSKLAPIFETGVTQAERTAAENLWLASELASSGHRDRELQVWDVLIGTGSLPRTWPEVFDRLTPDDIRRLGELYDALPDPARREYDRRYGRPDLTGETNS